MIYLKSIEFLDSGVLGDKSSLLQVIDSGGGWILHFISVAGRTKSKLAVANSKKTGLLEQKCQKCEKKNLVENFNF